MKINGPQNNKGAFKKESALILIMGFAPRLSFTGEKASCGFTHLGELLQHHVAFQAREVINEEYAF